MFSFPFSTSPWKEGHLATRGEFPYHLRFLFKPVLDVPLFELGFYFNLVLDIHLFDRDFITFTAPAFKTRLLESRNLHKASITSSALVKQIHFSKHKRRSIGNGPNLRL